MNVDDPQWYRRAIFYEVLVRGFNDSSGDGTGDLRGVTEKLDYLEWLGIDCLWLLPFYSSPLKDGGYDIADFYEVHPDFGTVWEGAPIGIPYVVVPNVQTMLAIDFASLDGWPGESDAGPYPIPPNPPIEGGDDPLNRGDRHILVVRHDRSDDP